MKRLTGEPAGLPGGQSQAGGRRCRTVSSYVATALADYQEQGSLDAILAAWRAESPVPHEVQREVEAELDDIGLTASARRAPG